MKRPFSGGSGSNRIRTAISRRSIGGTANKNGAVARAVLP
jgi:hypothetical protein